MRFFDSVVEEVHEEAFFYETRCICWVGEVDPYEGGGFEWLC